MLETITKVAPPTLMFGLCAYGLIAAGFLQPAIESRMAAKEFVPACQQLIESQHTAAAQTTSKARSAKERQFEALKQLMGPITEIPEINDLMESAKEMAQADVPDIELPKRVDAATPCGCAVGVVLDDNKFAMMLHVASARLYQPSFLKFVPQTALAVIGSGRCGEA